MNKLYTPEEVAQLFKTGVRTVRIWLRKGVLKGFKDKSFWLIRQEDIDEFIIRKNSLSDKVKLEAVIYNANKQPVGKVQFTQTAINILHDRKVPFVLNNAEITAACREIFLANAVMRSKPKIDDIANYRFSPRLAISLYDDYYLSVGEIAAVFNLPYHTAYILTRPLPMKTGDKSGRRSTTYGKHHTPATKHKIALSRRGKGLRSSCQYQICEGGSH